MVSSREGNIRTNGKRTDKEKKKERRTRREEGIGARRLYERLDDSSRSQRKGGEDHWGSRRGPTSIAPQEQTQRSRFPQGVVPFLWRSSPCHVSVVSSTETLLFSSGNIAHLLCQLNPVKNKFNPLAWSVN